MKLKIIALILVCIITFGLFAMAENVEAKESGAKEISVWASIVAYCPKTVFAEGTFTFNPDKIIPNPKDTEERCRPVGLSSPVFGDNKEIQITIDALKCGPHPLYYSFNVKYYDLEVSHVISHKKLKMLGKFRIVLEPRQGDKFKTPKGDKRYLYFEGGIAHE